MGCEQSANITLNANHYADAAAKNPFLFTPQKKNYHRHAVRRSTLASVNFSSSLKIFHKTIFQVLKFFRSR